MASGSMPIQVCDCDVEWCDEWMPDYYAMGAAGWRRLVPDGWSFDPRTDHALCPEHAPKPEES